MLKKRSSRPVSTTKQGLMADHQYPLINKHPNSPIFNSPRAMVGFFESTDIAVSPTSILETKPFSNPFFADKNRPRKPVLVASANETTREPVGLGIVDALKTSSRPDSRMVLFGSQLKIHIPSIAPTAIVDSPRSPIEFGIKNKKSQLALIPPAMRSPIGSAGLVSGSLSATEMEMSDDYTCVISHGPNPKTTHIFDNCVIESCCGGSEGFVCAAPRKENEYALDHSRGSGFRSDDFLTFCHACKKSLGQGKDIFMYRGEKAFCSHECRYQEILFDEGMEDRSADC